MDRSRLDRSVQVARLSTCKQRHGALVVSGGRTLAVGVNSYSNPPGTPGVGPGQFSIHAEAAALRAIPEDIDLRRATLYVARLSKGGNIAMSKPCRECQALIEARGIRKICYTINTKESIT